MGAHTGTCIDVCVDISRYACENEFVYVQWFPISDYTCALCPKLIKMDYRKSVYVCCDPPQLLS